MITSKTIPSFWQCYRDLPDPVRKAAQKAFENWKENPFHPSLRFKCIESKPMYGQLELPLVTEHCVYTKATRPRGFG
jgi:hypothetical protein